MIHEKGSSQQLANKACRPIGVFYSEEKAEEYLDEVKEVHFQTYVEELLMISEIPSKVEATQIAEEYFNKRMEYYVVEMEVGE